MCLLSLIDRLLPDCPLLMLANRDERRDRPAEPPRIHSGQTRSWLGGIDLEQGGTWLGINDAGLIVAITNRPKSNIPAEPRSRGLLCRDLLDRPTIETARDEALQLLTSEPFDGCNVLLAGIGQTVLIEAADDLRTIPLPPGIHTIANGPLDDPHNPRIERIARSLQQFSTSDHELGDWLAEAQRLCGLPSEDNQPALCLSDGSWGTVSAAVIALTDQPANVRYLHADGPPNGAPFRDDSLRLRNLLQAGQSAAPHHINLRGPWQYEWVSAPADGIAPPTAGRTTLPATWQDLFGPAPGTARFRRRFHRPTNLEPHEQVRIRFENLGGSAVVALNGTQLGTISRAQSAAAFNVTDHLKPSNELTVDVTFDPRHDSPTHTGLLAPVVIEIISV